MSMEQNEMQGSQGQQAPPAVTLAASQEGSSASPSNSQGQRRRRRRRKPNKGPVAQGASGPGTLIIQPAPGDDAESPQQAVPAEAVPAAPQPRNHRGERSERGPSQDGTRDQQQPRQAHQQGQSGKKQHKGRNGSNGSAPHGSGTGQGRQFQKGGYSQQPSAGREYNPGNGSPSNNGGAMANGAGARRKVKGRRSAPSFVGPMDHSYRVVNGNVADGSPSTMDFRSNGNGNGYSRASYAEAVEVPVSLVPRSDAPTRILCFIEELFVVARMQEHARKLGVKVGFCKAEKETVANLMELPEAERPSLIIFDLNNANAKPLTLIPKLKAKLKRGTSIIGYLSHIQGDLKLKAIEAGCDTVMPKSAFSQNLPNLLRRHGLEEEEVQALEV